MFIAVVSWWYTTGWGLERSRGVERLARYYDFFSLDLLIKTLFSPFRQISVGKVNGPLAVQWRAFIDRVISRFIGAMIRTFMIVFGSLAIIGIGLVTLIQIALWPLLPFLPVLGLILASTGWIPW